MEKILFLAHTESDGNLGRAALEALSSAVALKQALAGSSLAAGFTGAATQPAADRIASCGATPFFAVTGPDFGISRYSTDAAAAEALCRASGATLVIVNREPTALDEAADYVILGGIGDLFAPLVPPG